ncbi:A24 family peptidase [Novosphingobium sp. B 225]|uniref:A24 family peptidase n=1 Tax=Novosphingobium sp. B 225 TaxID=1961849 RepID=UPI000B4A6F86|nr:prepilin peptidase [Novosphingobium sp. B 225]
MPDVDFRYLLLGALAIALVYACFTDIRSRLIENWLTAGIALAAPLYWLASGMAVYPDMAWQLGMGAVTFGLLALVFFLGWIGGGDVKLLAALALWFSPTHFFQLVFMASVVGGLMTTMGSLFNLAPVAGRTGGRVMVYASSAVSVTVMLYVGWVLNGGKPVNLAHFTNKLLPTGLSSAGLLIVLALIMGFISVGSLVTARHQREKLRIPYGVAISAGGIWAIVVHLLPLLHHTNSAGSLG